MREPPEHTRIRRLLTGRFTVRRLRQPTSAVQQIGGEQSSSVPPVF
ncbi:hypothetical protein [Streptomyces sp. NPDC054765]